MTSCKFCGKKEPVMFCICPDCADKLQPQWVSVKERMPEEGEMTLVAVSGKPRKNITLKNAVELAEYTVSEGWILEMWPEWTGAEITHWMPLPELSGCTKTGDCPQWYAWFCEILDEICKEKEIEKAHNKKERRKKK